MNHHAKALSAGSTEATGNNSRGLLRCVIAIRGALGRSEGSGAPSSRRAPIALIAALATILALALTPALALAAPPTTTTPEVVSSSYGTAEVKGKVTTDGSGGFNLTAYSFQVSTDNVNWTTAASATFGGGAATNKEVKATLGELKSGTKYFVRLTAENFVLGGPVTEAISPGPNPSFTTLTTDPPKVLTIDTASEVAYTTAKVTGKILRPEKSDNVACHFEYITDAQFTGNPSGDKYAGATSVPCEPEESVATIGEVPVSASLTGLDDATAYHQRLVVSNAGPTADAKEGPTFTTLTVDPPSVKSIANATEVEYTTAKVKGVVERPANPDPAFDLNCNFEYVTDAQFADNPPGDKFAGATPVACEGENPITANTPPGPTPVEATLTGLVSTTYHLRLSAYNLGGSDSEEATATFTTQGPVPKPTVTAVNDASEVKFNSAKFTGKVLRPNGADPALNTNCHFEYITDAQFTANEGNGDPGFTGAGSIDCAENPITSDGETTVSAQPSGLKPETTYHIRLLAENAGGSDSKDATNTFNTPEAEKPTVTIDPVAGGTYTTAHVTGTVTFDPGQLSTSGTTYLLIGYEYSTDNVNWSTEGRVAEPSSPASGTVDIEHTFTGLQPSTTYYFRIGASYYGSGYEVNRENGEVGFSPGPNPSITTEPPQAPPTAENLAITDITGTSAHLSAKVDPHAPAGPLSEVAKKAFATKWHFECIPECKNANGNEIEGTVQGEGGAQTVAGDAKRLDPNTEYEVSLIISSEGGGETKVETFKTVKIPPTVKSAPGASDGKGGYTLQGVVNPNKETVTDCKFEWGPNSSHLDFSADCSPMPSGGSKPVTVEAHLSGLNTGVTYHALLVVTYGAGAKADGGPQEFEATLDPPESCPNEQARKENSSLALPECRAYEMVSPPGKEGFYAAFRGYGDGDRVRYESGAGNIAKSGEGGFAENFYVAARSAAGWETIPNLNGSSGSLYDAPSNLKTGGAGFPPYPVRYSPDLLSSVWIVTKIGSTIGNYYLRGPNGMFTLIGPSVDPLEGKYSYAISGTSDDLSHLFITSQNIYPTLWGPGVYEYLGTGNEQPRRVDVNNSGSPISTCGVAAYSAFNSRDGRVALVRALGGCGGSNPPTDELWARIDGTTSIDVSASQCNRVDCNAPSEPTFQGATPDGSRIFFTTRQQLLDADTNETNDIYACDIPSGTPAPAGDANPCSALRRVSAGDPAGADVESFGTSSENGATVLFTAKGVLADNEDALEEKAVAGDHNLYAWRTDASHPDGQTAFVGRLNADDLAFGGAFPQATPDGRYLVFTTASQLLETDTDNARDVYRYDADTGDLTRASTNVVGVGVGGNGPFDAEISPAAEHNPTTAISDDGQKIVFNTTEALSSADGNAEPDVYLWTPDRVSLVSTGSSGFAPKGNFSVKPVIDPSGQDIYFNSAQPLTPADGDDSNDVYDARIGGGFSFAEAAMCSGEACKPSPSPSLLTPSSPANRANGEGNVKLPKPCPKAKVRNKKGKCTKKPKKHSGKKHHGKKASHKQGGGK